MQKAWSAALVLVPMLALGGCALPPAVMIVSYSADIVSYAATGKTVTDHAYSAVARSDCSFIRILHDKPICVDEPGNAPEPAKDVQVAQADTAAPAAAPAGEAAPARDTYVRIGSFLDAANAERSAVRYADYHAVIVAVTVQGRHFHRVVAGPLSHDEAAALKGKVLTAAAGSKHARG